jgi:hypothetical protein
MVAFDIEHYAVISQERSTWIISFDLVRPFPTGIFSFLVPCFKLLLTVGMLFPKVSKCFFRYYPQAGFLPKIEKSSQNGKCFRGRVLKAIKPGRMYFRIMNGSG